MIRCYFNILPECFRWFTLIYYNKKYNQSSSQTENDIWIIFHEFSRRVPTVFSDKFCKNKTWFQKFISQKEN